MSVRRLVAAEIAVVFCLAVAGAEELPLESVSNWSAPLYWMPVKSAVEKPGETGLTPSGVEGVPTPALAFTGITPCRLVDTRGNGFSGAYGPPALIAGVPRPFTLTGRCGIPGGAEAVSLNVTVTGTQGPGHIVLYPQGGAQPTVSTLNYVGGQTIANAAVVPLGAGGGITVVAGVSGTDLILDTNGYYAPQTVVSTVNGLSGPVTLAAGSNISITPGVGNSLTIADTAPAAWRLTGNSGTTPGTNFLGTTDDQAFQIKVRNLPALRLLPPPVGFLDPNLIGGSVNNFVNLSAMGQTIAGGGGGEGANAVIGSYGTVGGGANNIADESATVAGGAHNQAEPYAAVPGGFLNYAYGINSFAAGRRAKANHNGAWVWGDYTETNVASTGPNQFIVRASGGIWLGTTSTPSLNIATNFLTTSTGARLTIGGIWTNNSDRDAKENFREVDEHDVLSRVATLPIMRWNYKAEGCEVEHIGPMAQDFAAAFGVGSDDRSIGTLDSSGVALAAIQALYEEVQELRKRLAALEGEKD